MTTVAPVESPEQLHRELVETLDRCLLERDRIKSEIVASRPAPSQLFVNLDRLARDITIARASVKAFRKIFGIAA